MAHNTKVLPKIFFTFLIPFFLANILHLLLQWFSSLVDVVEIWPSSDSLSTTLSLLKSFMIPKFLHKVVYKTSSPLLLTIILWIWELVGELINLHSYHSHAPVFVVCCD